MISYIKKVVTLKFALHVSDSLKEFSLKSSGIHSDKCSNIASVKWAQGMGISMATASVRWLKEDEKSKSVIVLNISPFLYHTYKILICLKNCHCAICKEPNHNSGTTGFKQQTFIECTSALMQVQVIIRFQCYKPSVICITCLI